MLGTNEKPEGYGVTFALNPWFKGYRLQRHLGDPSFHLFVNNSFMTLNAQQILLRQQIRSEMRQRRASLLPEQQKFAAKMVTRRVINHEKIQRAKNIAVFLSCDGEIETQPLIKQLWFLQKQVYLPVLHPFSKGHLLFLHYHASTPLIINRFKIPEPQLDVRTVLPLAELDIILTPLVAFDRQGRRLGRGGGFYDRTLQYWQQSGLYPIGLAHDCQLVDELVAEDWDIPLPEVITPAQIWQFANSFIGCRPNSLK